MKSTKSQTGQTWLNCHWRRILVDMHIPDWDPSFLSKLSPERYVDLMKEGGATSAMVYANSHIGLCMYPTKIGRMHHGLNGRNFFREVIDLCHKAGIAVVAYYSLIYNNLAYIENPDWRIRLLTFQKGRYGTCCPNSPYREFALTQTAEICEEYDCEGIFFDMTFWPGVCYCSHCTARYRQEEGLEPPTIVDWQDPEWVKFQRTRERWMGEFAGVMTQRVRSVKPAMTATHQFATVVKDWIHGVSFDQVEHSDYLCGDFYGPAVQQSMICKVFFALSLNRPFEFMTSCCQDLRDHVSLKSSERLKSQAFVAPAHGSALLLIDAIDPDGQMNEGAYPLMRSVFDKLGPYEQELGGELCADVGVYFSDRSKFDPAENGRCVTEFQLEASPIPHIQALLGACRSLQEAHIPFAVVTRINLGNLAKYQVVVLPDVLVMDADEIEAIKRFVHGGGTVYASYRTSLYRADGAASSDFALSELFGVSVTNNSTLQKLVYFTPADDKFKGWISPQKHVAHFCGSVSVAKQTARVLANKTLPYGNLDDTDIFEEKFASIHSWPPSPVGSGPAVVLNRYGSGKVIYSTGALEASELASNRCLVAKLISSLLCKPTWFKADAHRGIEIILFQQPARKRMLISLVCSDENLVDIPIDAALTLRVPPGVKSKRMFHVATNDPVDYVECEGAIKASITVTTFDMIALEYD